MENINLNDENKIKNIQENNEDNFKMDIEIENDDEKSNNNNNLTNNNENNNFNSITIQKEENENNKISANITNISQYFTKINDKDHLDLIEKHNLSITQNIDELKNAITEKEKEIADIIKQMKNFN